MGKRTVRLLFLVVQRNCTCIKNEICDDDFDAAPEQSIPRYALMQRDMILAVFRLLRVLLVKSSSDRLA